MCVITALRCKRPYAENKSSNQFVELEAYPVFRDTFWFVFFGDTFWFVFFGDTFWFVSKAGIHRPGLASITSPCLRTRH